MKKYRDDTEYKQDNCHNAYKDYCRANKSPEYDKVYVQLLDAADVIELGGMVRRLRDDAVTLHFFHKINAPPSALKDDVEASKIQNRNPLGLYLYWSPDEIRFHAVYAIERLLNFCRLTHDEEIETLVLRRIMHLLNEYNV